MNGGGIHATNSSRLNTTNISMHSNVALEYGGGIGLDSGSSLLCIRCDFRNNMAKWGGGMTAWVYDGILVVAQLQDSSFENNTAHDYGGK